MSTALLLLAVEEELETGPIGLVIILLLLVATFFLIRNMNTRIKRLPPRFPGQDENEPAEQPRDGQEREPGR